MEHIRRQEERHDEDKRPCHFGFLKVVASVPLDFLLLRGYLELLAVGGKNGRDANTRQYAHDRSKDQHQTNHDTSKVDAGHSIQDDEDIGIGQFGEAVIEPDGKHEDEELEIEVETGPGRRLMFGYRGNDGDVVFGV